MKVAAIPAPGDLASLSITSLRDAYSAGQLLPSDLVRAQIERIEALNPRLNALVGLELEAALDAADAASARYHAGTARPLEGITVAIKEAHAFAGRVSTAGSFTHDGRRDAISAPSVRRLIDAGAIAVGRSTTPEFSMCASTHSPRYGTSLNPWDLRYSPGGSSGGAAAAVAAGLVTFADGSDHGGSIRTPAACCGVYGYKSPWGNVPLPADQLGDICQHYGLLCRSLSDLLFAQDVIVGPDEADPWSQRNPPRLSGLVATDRPLKLAVTADFGSFAVCSSVRDLLDRAVSRLRQHNVQVEQCDLRLPAGALAAYEGYCLRQARLRLGPLVARSRAPVADYVQEYLLRAKAARDETTSFARFHSVRETFLASVSDLLRKVDVLLAPVSCSVGLNPCFSITRPHPAPDTASVVWEEEWQMTWPFNVASSLPVLAVPAGLDAATGLPFGIQLVGRPSGEADLMWSALYIQPFLDPRREHAA